MSNTKPWAYIAERAKHVRLVKHLVDYKIMTMDTIKAIEKKK